MIKQWMMKLTTIVACAVISFSAAAAEEKKDLENTVYLELKDGRVEIQLLPNLAPNHVARIKELVNQKFYDGIVFHRVIDGFMAQTGDPTGTGMGGSGKRLKAEFSDEPHVRGIVSMARAGHPDSADSQFFIVFKDSNFLDGNYTVFGRVIKGMELVDKIKKGAGENGTVDNPDKIISMRMASAVAADAKPSDAAASKEAEAQQATTPTSDTAAPKSAAQ